MSRTILTCDQVLSCANISNITDALKTIYQDTDHNGFISTVQLDDGTYNVTGIINAVQMPLGLNQFAIKGNLTHPENVVLTASSGACVQARDCGIVSVSGVELRGTIGLNASQFGVIDFANVNFGACGIHQAIQGAGAINCVDGPSVASKITGNAAHWLSMVGAGGNHSMGGVTIRANNGLTFTSFIRMFGPTMINWGFNYFANQDGTAGASITGAQKSCSDGYIISLAGTTIPGTP